MRRARSVRRKSASADDLLNINSLKALYFDGRKDTTFRIDKAEDRNYRRKVVEEHLVLVSEPDSNYIAHAVRDTGSSESLTKAILETLSNKTVSLEELSAIGCDGTAVNTGAKGGVIRRIESWVTLLIYLMGDSRDV